MSALTAPGVKKTGDTMTGPLKTVPANVAGAGTTAGGATVLSSTVTFNRVTSGANNSGLRLPPSGGTGQTIRVYNTTVNTILVYPPAGGTINALSANTAFSLATNTGSSFIGGTDLAWYTV